MEKSKGTGNLKESPVPLQSSKGNKNLSLKETGSIASSNHLKSIVLSGRKGTNQEEQSPDSNNSSPYCDTSIKSGKFGNTSNSSPKLDTFEEFDVSNEPAARLISEREKKLCNSIRLKPMQYITLKTLLLKVIS